MKAADDLPEAQSGARNPMGLVRESGVITLGTPFALSAGNAAWSARGTGLKPVTFVGHFRLTEGLVKMNMRSHAPGCWAAGRRPLGRN